MTEPVFGTWHPIETAPKDGTVILGPDGDEVYWSDQRFCALGMPAGSCGPGWVSVLAGHLPVDAPTHWSPVPPPPEGEK
jgi:hypothetical protein